MDTKRKYNSHERAEGYVKGWIMFFVSVVCIVIKGGFIVSIPLGIYALYNIWFFYKDRSSYEKGDTITEIYNKKKLGRKMPDESKELVSYIAYLLGDSVEDYNRDHYPQINIKVSWDGGRWNGSDWTYKNDEKYLTEKYKQKGYFEYSSLKFDENLSRKDHDLLSQEQKDKLKEYRLYLCDCYYKEFMEEVYKQTGHY